MSGDFECAIGSPMTSAKDLTTLTEATEALNRTLNMFRGVVSKTRG